MEYAPPLELEIALRDPKWPRKASATLGIALGIFIGVGPQLFFEKVAERITGIIG